MKKIIYIIGAARSGTTLLAIILGNAKNVVSGGELNRYPKRKGIPPNCKEGSENFNFWRRMREKLSPLLNFEKLDDLHSKYEYHWSVIKYMIGWPKGKAHKQYQQFLKDFYNHLFKLTRAHIIIDSSKYPGRALNISHCLPYEINYIYLKCDPVSVVNSFAKKDIEQPTKSWLSANFYYLIVNMLCVFTIKKLRKKHRVIEIKYEHLIMQPEQVLKNIQKELDCDLSTAIEKIELNRELKTGKLFDGNRIRLKGAIKLKRELTTYPNNFRNGLTRLFNS